MKNLNNKAFSLLEILLSSIIFIITVGGVFATLNAVRIPVANKENALTAAIFGKQVLECLRSQVDARTYYNSCSVVQSPCPDFSLSVGSHLVPTTTLNTTEGLYWPTGFAAVNPNGLSYSVVCADGSNPCNADSSRQVNLNINWPDVT